MHYVTSGYLDTLCNLCTYNGFISLIGKVLSQVHGFKVCNFFGISNGGRYIVPNGSSQVGEAFGVIFCYVQIIDTCRSRVVPMYVFVVFK